jgi:PhnB protein
MASVNPVPKGYHTATPYLCIDGAARAIDFYKKAFGATEVMRMDVPEGKGKVGHAEISIGDSRIMISDEFPDMGWRAPKAGGSPVMIHLYVDDVDDTARKAKAAGAKELEPVVDQFYGDRGGKFSDPFGHLWFIATHKEDLTPEEMAKRAAKRMPKP